jgi:hypothetical protein
MTEMLLPNPMAAMMQGLQAGNAVGEMRRKNKLNEVMSTHGPGIFAGDPNALAAYAKVDPVGAFEMKAKMENRRRDDVRFQQNNQLFQMKVDEYAQNKNAAQLKADRDEIARGLAGAAYFYENGDEEGFNNYIAGLGEAAEGVTFDNFPAVAGQYETVIERLDFWAERKAGPEPVSTPGKVEYDRRRGLLPEDYQGEKDGAAEEKIRRLMELPNPRTGQSYTREEAISAAEYHEMAQDGTVINTLTGNRVGVAAVPLPAGADDPAFEEPTIADGIGGATGAPGAFLDVVNTLLDAAFAEPASDAALKATSALEKLNTETMLVLSAEIDGRPTNFTREQIMANLPKPNAIFQGPARTRDKAFETAKMALDMLRDLQAIIEGNGFTADQRAKAKALYPKVSRIFQQYYGLFEAMEGRGNSVANDDDAALIDKWAP